MSTIRQAVIDALLADATVVALAEGGILDRPLVPSGQIGYQASSWVTNVNDPMVGFPKPLLEVSDPSEQLEEAVIDAAEGFLSVRAYGPKHSGGKSQVRLLVEAVFDVLHKAELEISIGGEGFVEIEWRGTSPIDDSVTIPTAVDAESRYHLSYVKRL